MSIKPRYSIDFKLSPHVKLSDNLKVVADTLESYKTDTVNLTTDCRNVLGHNLAKLYVLDALPTIYENLLPLQGKKVKLGGGAKTHLLKKQVEIMPTFAYNEKVKISTRQHFSFDYSNLVYNFDLTLYCSEFSVNYYKREVYFPMNSENKQVLGTLPTYETIVKTHELNKLYSLDSVLETKFRITQLQTELSSLRYDISPFIN